MGWTIQGQNPGTSKIFFIQTVQIGPDTHPVFYTISTGLSFLAGNMAGV